MSRLPQSELKLEQSVEDMFWKQKTWSGFENETNVETLREAIKYLLELCAQRQGVIKSLIQFQMKQDAAEMQALMEQRKNTQIKRPQMWPMLFKSIQVKILNLLRMNHDHHSKL